jgi:hypothetical protein
MKEGVNGQSILEMMSSSLERLHPDDIAFLFATGKNELFLRDILGSYMNRNLGLSGNEFVAREWKKHDLAIVDGHTPLILIEGKSWIHYDAASKGKLLKGKKSVREAMEIDIKKMRKTLNQFPHARAFITNILFSVEVSEEFPLEFGHLTYGKYHEQGRRKNGTYEKLFSTGVCQLRDLMERYGNVSHSEMLAGIYAGLRVRFDFLVLELWPGP